MNSRRGAVLLVAAVVAGGCGGQTADQWLKEKLFPPPTVTQVARIESDRPDERREALQKVAADPSARRTPEVVKLFCLVARSDKDPMVRAAAVRGLGDMEGPDVAAALAQVLADDKSPYVRRDAAEALGRRGAPEGAAALAAALAGDASTDVRIEAAQALRQFKDKAAATALAAAVQDPGIAVAQRAWESLRYMTGQDLPRQSQPWTEFLASNENPFAGYGKPPALPKGGNQRPQFTRGIGDFFLDLFKRDARQAELE